MAYESICEETHLYIINVVSQKYNFESHDQSHNNKFRTVLTPV